MNYIVGPSFLEQDLNSHLYLDISDTLIYPQSLTLCYRIKN